MSVRVRFAPSPTGNLHVGSARTALFNHFFAKRNTGTFILRIEDTDLKRSDEVFLKDIYESLEFLGIHIDEGPFFQSKRFDIYKEYAQKLLSAGSAKEEDGGIIYPVSSRTITFDDLLHGKISVDTSLFESLVLMKRDGTPTYHFACVIDDALMEISHVIRGDDHIANTPKQIVLQQALGLPTPTYAHIPLIVGADRSRLSKRDGATSVNEYRAAGYLPEAFVNYLALLGWAPGGNREYMPPAEIVQNFDLSKVKKAAAQFDQTKLDWLNGQYIKKMDIDLLSELLGKRLVDAGLLPDSYDKPWLKRIASLVQDRLKVLSDIEKEHVFFFKEQVEYNQEAVEKFLHQDGLKGRFHELHKRLSQLAEFTFEKIEEVTRCLIAEQDLKSKQLIHPMRGALSGRAVSPPLFESAAILGREKALARIEYAANHLVKNGK